VLTIREPNPRRSDGDERLAAPVELIVAGGDSAEVLAATQQAFKKVAPFVGMTVEVTELSSNGTWGDDCLRPATGDRVDQGLRAVGFAGSDASAGMPSSSGSASVTSAARPAVRRQRARLPRASTTTWSLVVSPPRERPIACAPPSVQSIDRRCSKSQAPLAIRAKTRNRPRFRVKLGALIPFGHQFRMPRHARIGAAGYPMHVIVHGIDRAAIFSPEADCRAFLAAPAELASSASACASESAERFAMVRLMMRRPSRIDSRIGRTDAGALRRIHPTG